MLKSNPILTRWATHKTGKQLNHRSYPTRLEVLSPMSGCQVWSLVTGEAVPRELGFEGQQDLTVGIPQGWRKQKLHSWKGADKSCVHQDSGEKSRTP